MNDIWWGHHCIDNGIDHGDNLLLHKTVLKCSICDTSQLELMFNEIGICDLDG